MTITNQQFEEIAVQFIEPITKHSQWFDSNQGDVAILDDLKRLYQWGGHDVTGSIPWDLESESMRRATLFLCWIGHAELYAAVDAVDCDGKSRAYQYRCIVSNPNAFESWMRGDVASRAGIDFANVGPMVVRRIRLKRRGMAMKFKTGQDLILEMIADAQREDQTRRDMSAVGIHELAPEFDSCETFDPHNLSDGTYSMVDDGLSGGAVRIPALATISQEMPHDEASGDRPAVAAAGGKTAVKRWTLKKANSAARAMFEDHPEMRLRGGREWAEHIGCSVGLIFGTAVWVANQEEIKKTVSKSRHGTVSLPENTKDSKAGNSVMDTLSDRENEENKKRKIQQFVESQSKDRNSRFVTIMGDNQ